MESTGYVITSCSKLKTRGVVVLWSFEEKVPTLGPSHSSLNDFEVRIDLKGLPYHLRTF